MTIITSRCNISDNVKGSKSVKGVPVVARSVLTSFSVEFINSLLLEENIKYCIQMFSFAATVS